MNFPGLQAIHALSTVLPIVPRTMYLPTKQFVQELTPELMAYVPFAQRVQKANPFVAAKLPLAQGEQTPWLEREKVPELQTLQEEVLLAP